MMPPSLNSPSPIITSLTPDLKQLLRDRSIIFLSRIIRQNTRTALFNEAPLLSSYRTRLDSAATTESSTLSYVETNATEKPFHHDSISAIDDQHLTELFFEDVPISSYDDYQPFVSRFFSEHAQLSSLKDLIAPGFPRYIAHSSGTTGGKFKHFPKYPENLPLESSGKPLANDIRAAPAAWCSLGSLRYTRMIEVTDDLAPGKTKSFPLCQLSAGMMRVSMGIEAEIVNESRMYQKTWPGSTSPLAVCFIPSYTPCLLMHAQFAIINPTISFFQGVFASLVYDFIGLLEEYWDILVDALEKGKLPPVYESELSAVKPYLEAQFKPNPERAAELRNIQRGAEGWLRKVWPSVKVIKANVGGVYSNVVPKLQHHFGPEVQIHDFIYASTECFVGLPFDPQNNSNLYKVSYREYIEYLDLEAVSTPSHSSQTHHAWEVEAGKKYEILVTNPDGLWRYRLGDVVQIAGFDPIDGQPLIRFIERQAVGFRIASEFVTEMDLRNAIKSVSRDLGTVLEFTVEMDIRKEKCCYGFFVEVNDMKNGEHAAAALANLREHMLASNEGYKYCSDFGHIGAPTIRILAPGTFQKYREWRTSEGTSIGQVKVPTVIKDPATREWFTSRVAHEVLEG